MKSLTKNIKMAIWTTIFATLMFIITSSFIASAYTDKADPVTQRLLGIMDGGMMGILALLYYTTMVTLQGSPVANDITEKVQDKVLRKAIYIAKMNRQHIRLENYPLVFFKRQDKYKVSINTGCSIFGKTPSIEFEIKKDFNIDVGNSTWVTVSSKPLPIDLAPDWLKESSVYKSAIKRSIHAIESEMKKNCKEGSLDKLKQAV